MKKPHIAFISFPHHPHVNPTLPIASVVARRGFKVSFATSDRFADRANDVGTDVVAIPKFQIDTLDDEVESGNRLHPPICQLAVRTLAPLIHAYKDDKPDLIIYDLLAFAGRILACKWNIPAIQTSPTFAHIREKWSEQVTNPSFRASLAEISRRANLFFERHGVIGGDFIFHRERLNIYLFPRALQPFVNFVDDRCFYAGRCAAEQPYFGDWKCPTANNRPIALVATSTTYIQGAEFFKMCIDAFSGLGWHVIMSIGDSGDAASLLPLPPHFEIVKNTSHIRILPHVDLQVCLGGIITSAEAAYHGVPLVVLSHGFPELEWQADNLERLGVGVHVRKADTNSKTLREVINRTANDLEMRRKVKRLQHETHREPGSEDTANRIEQYINSANGSDGLHDVK